MGLHGFNRSLVTVNRWSGYLLFICVLLYFVTGYGMTKQIIDRSTAKLLHERWLPAPVFVLFTLHSLINIKLILLRKGIRDRVWWNIYLLTLGLILLSAFFYIYLR